MTRRALPLVAVLSATLLVPALHAQSTGLPQQTQTVQEDAWPPAAGVLRSQARGLQAPRVVKEMKPGYTAEAMRAQIQGTVEVEAIVKADGTVGDVRVVRSLDKEHGLDDAAIRAVKGWEFKPGQKDGQVVPVLVNIELTFSLRKR